VSRRTQKIVILVVALALVVPFGAIGLSQLFTQNSPHRADDPSAAQSTESRPPADPDSQPDPAPTDKPKAPKGLDDRSADGAQAAASYLMDSYAYMMATGDTSIWDDLVDPNCQVCTSFLSNAKQLHKQKGYQVGGEFTVKKASFDGSGKPPSSGTVTLKVSQGPAQIIDDPKLQPGDVPPFDGTMQMQMNWDGKRWTVGDMSIVDGGSDGGAGGGAGADGGAGIGGDVPGGSGQ
jgi:hypothetical protein